MTKGLDELIWSKEYEDVHDWVECLTMAIDMKVSDQGQVIQICKVEFMKQTKYWLKSLNPTLANWIKL